MVSWCDIYKSKNILNIFSFLIKVIPNFLWNHKSGEFRNYAVLIKNANNINAKNSLEYDLSALHKGIYWIDNIKISWSFPLTAAETGHKDVVEIFLLNGAELDIKDKKGRIPLHSGIIIKIKTNNCHFISSISCLEGTQNCFAVSVIKRCWG